MTKKTPDVTLNPMNNFIVSLFFIVAFLGCASKNLQEQAAVPHLEKSIISDICFNGQEPSQTPSGELRTLLISTQKQYSTKELRKADPQEFVIALENIIEQTEFKYLLECKTNWEKSKNHRFRVSFPENLKNMELATSEEKDINGKNIKVLEVHMWLNASVQQVLPTYMHELLHVCQHEATMDIWRRFNLAYAKLNPREKWTVAKRTWNEEANVPKNFQMVESKAVAEAEELYRAVNRDQILNEISAMYLMRNAYERFVQIDPGYCEEDSVPENRKKNLALAYATSTDEIKSGIFAQRVVSWYKSTQLEGLFQNDSKEVFYPASNNGPAFKMKHLEPLFKKQIEEQGIPVQEKN